MKHIFAVACAFTLVLAPGAKADTTSIHSLWQEGDHEAVHTGLLSPQNLEETALEHSTRGLRLIDIETARVNGARGFAGLFAEGTGGNSFHVNLSLRQMRQKMQEERAAGLHLVDAEVYRVNGTTRYAAVFRPGEGREKLERPLNFKEFLERKEILRTLGLRLRDVEPVVIDGKFRFVGLYSTEVAPTVLTGFRPRERFTEMRDRMVTDGWEMVDFERVKNAEGEDVYIGLWREGNGPSRISRFRTPARQLFFTGQQRQNGFVPLDMELKVRPSETAEDDGPRPDPVPPQEVPRLPENPAHVEVGASNSQQLEIEFTSPPDLPAKITIPEGWLAEWLPRHEGDVLIPDAHCGMNITGVDRIEWQVGDSVINDNIFRSGEVTGSNNILGGISFSGPIGACAGQDVPWVFNPPFTVQSQVITPLHNMRLTIEGTSAQARFQHFEAPVEEFFEAHELFSDEMESELDDLFELFASLAEGNGNTDDYCLMVGAYWTAYCSTFPGQDCNVPHNKLPACEAN